MKKDKVTNVFAAAEGVVIEINGEKICLSWDVVDKIAEVSEPHYQQQTIDIFKIMSNSMKLN